MTTPASSNFAVGTLAPMLALAALALGVLALVAPLPFLRPPERQSDAAPLPLGPSRPKPTVKPIVPDDWSALAERFSMLREPVSEAQLAGLVQGTAESPVQVEPFSGPSYQPLRWRYLGCIVEPDRVAALVLMNDTNQRLLYPGQRLIDEFDAENLTIEVLSVTDREIVIERAGRQERFQLSLPAPESASATSPLRPAASPPQRGTPPPRRR